MSAFLSLNQCIDAQGPEITSADALVCYDGVTGQWHALAEIIVQNEGCPGGHC
jgi:hypothetical protein